MKKYRDILILCASLAVMLFFLGNVCPIEHIIGIPCPGCNMFTALYWLFVKGDIATAQYFHPAIWAFLCYIGLIGFFFLRYKEKMTQTKGFKICSVLFVTVFIGVYVYRMLTIFPQFPMLLNENAILVKLFHLM